MTEYQFIAWLEQPAATRMVLIEVQVSVGGVETTRYLSSRNYVTGAADTPANTQYLPYVQGGLAFTEQIGLTGAAGLSVGDIELGNADGRIDSWLLDVWANRPIKMWLGDPAWSRADFQLVFDGLVSDVGSASRDTINLVLRDKMQRLNTPILEAKLGGTTENKDEVLPVPFGECHNVRPLLSDTNLLYRFGCPIEWVMGGAEFGPEARYNAKPVSITPDLAAGRFRLTLNPLGSTVTCSVQGDNVGGYAPRIAPLVQRIATGYGKATGRLTVDEIDTANFAAFDVAHPQVVGRYVEDRTNQAVVIQELAASVGAQALMSRLGKLRLVQIALPAAGTPFAIGPQHMRERSLRPAQRLPAVAAAKVAFDRNYTVQENLTSDIPQLHADLYATEWLTETAIDTAAQALYRLTDDPVQAETCLKRRSDAAAEAARRQALYGVPRTVFEFDGEPALQRLELGQAVTLTADRWSLAARDGIVVSLQRYWLTGRVTVGVMV